MKKIIFYTVVAIIAIMGFITVSCDKYEDQDKKVTYIIKNLNDTFILAYLNNEAKLVYDTVKLADPTNGWKYEYIGKRGDLLYLYIRHRENVTMNNKFDARILIDGKTYRESYNYMMKTADPKFPNQINMRGVVPF